MVERVIWSTAIVAAVITPSTAMAQVGDRRPQTEQAGGEALSSFTPRLAVRYAVRPGLNAYASYSRGFKAGVLNANSLQVAPVKPELIDAFEIGLKGAASPVLSFDLAAFYHDYRNLQLLSYGASTAVQVLRNAASAEIYGLEDNAFLRPAEGLSLRAGFAYAHAQYQKFPGAPGFRPTTNAAGVPIGGSTNFSFDGSGRPIIRTPRFQVNGTISYETKTASGGAAGFDLNGSYFGSIFHDTSGNTRQPAYTAFNENIAYTTPDDHWRASVFGTNLLNEKYLVGVLISALSTAVTYSRPATYGVKLEYSF